MGAWPAAAYIGRVAAHNQTRIYLDHAATAPTEPAALAAMAEAAAIWANPASPHAEGRATAAALERARAAIVRGLGATGTLVFTSGASEAVRIALTRTRAACVLVSAVEHRCILATVPDAPRLPVDAHGRVRLDALAAALAAAPAPALVVLQHANGETGVVQPVVEAAALVRAAGGLLLVDAAQTAARLPWPDGADLVAVSAHKLGGPPGVGALIVRDPATVLPDGGTAEGGLRTGTANLPGAAGFAAALAARAADSGWPARTAALAHRLEARLGAHGAVVAGGGAPRLPILAVAMPGVEAVRQLMIFDLAGFAVGVGAACASGTVSVSPTLAAMGFPHADCAIRVSPGWRTTGADVDAFAGLWAATAQRLGPARRHAA